VIVELPVPTEVDFGAGLLEQLGGYTGRYGGRVLLVTGRTGARKHGITDRAVQSIAAAGGEAVVFEGVSANPRTGEVDSAARVGAGCDVIVGLGGGSAIDAAKAVSAVLSLGCPAAQLIGVTLEPGAELLPVVAVPTTCGSGSEVSKGAIVTDPVRRLRAGIRGEQLFPRVALVDPELTRTLPRDALLDGVFDAFAHAVEGYVAAASTTESRERSVRVLELIVSRIDAAARGVSSPALRADLSLAALLGGANVATVSTCLPHRLQQAMGSVPGLEVSHGRGLALLYPAWVRATAPFAPDLFGALAARLNADTAAEGIDGLLVRAGIGGRLRDHGIRGADIDTMIAGVTGNLGNDPAPRTDEAHLRGIYEAAF
jgi:alcohol dehydrogenase class IV